MMMMKPPHNNQLMMMKPPSIVLLNDDELIPVTVIVHNTLLWKKWLMKINGMRKNEGRNVFLKTSTLSNASFPS
jgi:hypothetical protein